MFHLLQIVVCLIFRIDGILGAEPKPYEQASLSLISLVQKSARQQRASVTQETHDVIQDGKTSTQGRAKVAVEIVESPTPQHMPDMHRPSTSDMVLGHLKVPNSNEKVDVYCYPANEDVIVSGKILDGEGWETESVNYCATPWLQNPNLKGNFLDLGGNIGSFTLPIGKLLAGRGEIITVEGIPHIAEHLKAGIVANNLYNVYLFQYCLGAPDGPNEITMNMKAGNKGMSIVADLDMFPDRTETTFKVGVTTLDAILAIHPPLRSVVSMKVDIEGSEGLMLKGANEFFSKHPPCYLQIELLPELLEMTGTPLAEVLQKLTEYGYTGGLVDDDKDYRLQQRDLAACLKRFT